MWRDPRVCFARRELSPINCIPLHTSKKMTTHIYPKKKFGPKVMAYDYDIERAIKNGNDLVFHFEGKIMTIPSKEINAKGFLSPNVYKSKYPGEHQTYKCYFYKWQPDDDTRTQKPVEADKVRDSGREQQGRLL